MHHLAGVLWLGLTLASPAAAVVAGPQEESTDAAAKITVELRLGDEKAELALTIASRDGKAFEFQPAWLSAANITIGKGEGAKALEGAVGGDAMTLPGGTEIHRVISLDAHREAIEAGAEIFWKCGKIALEPLRAARLEPSDVSEGDGSEADLRKVFAEMDAKALAKYRVTMKTSKGKMTLEFFPDKAPNHVRNFLTLSLSGYYKGKIFHRVIRDFMIQGGSPYGLGTGSHGPNLKLEVTKPPVQHERGVLSMARTQDPNSASCQFFICHKKAAHLDGQYSAFGKLVSGFDTLDSIATTPTNAQGRPIEEVKILDVIVEDKDHPGRMESSN